MSVARHEGNVGLLQQKETIIFPPYCTIVHLSWGSWACVFPPPSSHSSSICPPPLNSNTACQHFYSFLSFCFLSLFFCDALRTAEDRFPQRTLCS